MSQQTPEEHEHAQPAAQHTGQRIAQPVAQTVGQRWNQRAGAGLRRALAAVTPLGWFTLAVALCCVLVAVTLHWQEAWFVLVVAIVLFWVALPFLFGARAYEARVDLARTTVVAGTDLHATVTITNASGRPQLPALVEVPVGAALREYPLPLLGAKQQAELPVDVVATQRGVVQVGPLTIAQRDPLGLLRRELTWPVSRTVHVHPATVYLPQHTAGLVRDLAGQPSRTLADADLSFHAIREYQQQDSLRHVHWKATAKTGALMVRQYEESQTARLAVLCDVVRDEYASPAEFELAVSAAASFSTQALRERREVFVGSAWSPGRMQPEIAGIERLPSRDPVALLNAWAELQQVEQATPAHRIEQLAQSLAVSGEDISALVVVTGSQPELARLRRVAVRFARNVRVLVVRCEWLASPTVHQFDGVTVCTIGALDDLPGLMLRGWR